jgi:predicted membrane channel-forming protein YqfA (hemolysin III family)
MAPPAGPVGRAFLALRWVAGLALVGIWVRFGAAPVVLIIIGGVLFTVGAISYHRPGPDLVPSALVPSAPIVACLA